MNSLNSTHMASFSRALPYMSCLRELILAHNSIATAGVAELADVLRFASCSVFFFIILARWLCVPLLLSSLRLAKLDLRSNRIGCFGAALLTEAMRDCQSWSELNLVINRSLLIVFPFLSQCPCWKLPLVFCVVFPFR